MTEPSATVRRNPGARTGAAKLFVVAAGFVGLFAVGLVAVGVSSSDAEARQRPRAHAAKSPVKQFSRRYALGQKHRSLRYMQPRPFAPAKNFAAIVVDANSGETLYGRNENEPRHPASVTKVMTLYLLFERIEAGDVSLDDEIAISPHAAAQKPTKLGLRPGRTIRVDDAIKALVTRSANDIAVAIAEAIGGDEANFARMMTEKARELGMSGTTYVNASGLPADEQITTARDLALLGRAVEERFPREYRYFSTRAFYYGGATIMNHNRLMSRVEGMDGIKTGYTNASGFNLLASVKRDGRYIVAVVMGGVSAPARDRIMADLIEEHIEDGSKTRVASVLRDAEKLAAATPSAAPAGAGVEPLAYVETRPAAQTEAQQAALAAVTPKTQEFDQTAVAAIAPAAPKPRTAFTPGALRPTPFAAIPPLFLSAANARQLGVRTASLDGSVYFAPPTKAPSPSLRWMAGAVPAKPRAADRRSDPNRKIALRVADEDETAKALRETLASEREAKAAEAEAEVPEGDASVEAEGDARPAGARTGWMIQVGAADDAAKAQSLLARAKSAVLALRGAEPFTEKTSRGSGALYRARFAGFDEKSAKKACKALKHSGFSCFATKN
ncbi:D-alanyl-D-alanine carboxypeptidase [Methylocella sp.]|uniref:D-alanyl-D-alanine carboxypeptidase n=1 Tax=Methylocella sp. TaxID=1978226 RepID=UPI0037844536